MPKPQTKDILRLNYEVLQAWASEDKGKREVKLLQLFDLLRQYDFERYMGHFLEGAKELRQSLMKEDMRSNKKEVIKETEKPFNSLFSQQKLP
jgi:hypothetical protein